MLLQSSTPTSIEFGKQNVCTSVLKSYGLQKVSIHKSPDVHGDDARGGSVQSCKLCSHSESLSNLLLCDRCEEAFHVSCLQPKVVLPIEEWFCDSCSNPKMNKKGASRKFRTMSQVIGPGQFELGPTLGTIAVMLKYPEPFMSKVRIGEAYQAQVPEWAPLNEVKIVKQDCSDYQLGSHSASRKRKQEFSSSTEEESLKKCQP